MAVEGQLGVDGDSKALAESTVSSVWQWIVYFAQ